MEKVGALNETAGDEGFVPLSAAADDPLNGAMPETVQAHVARTVVRVSEGAQGNAAQEDDRLAAEVPVALEYNGISYAVMLATPTDLEDFAMGFSLTEGIVSQASQIYDMEVSPSCDGKGIVVTVEIARACEYALKMRRRSMSGRTGCGLCGVEALPDAVRSIAAVPTGPQVAATHLFDALQSMRKQQALFQATGASHAAGWADANGKVHCVREDVGRHNALDKLIGAMHRQKSNDPSQGFVLVSSRASFEMVQKTAAAGIGMLAAVSAPTSLAADLAVRLNVALAGFVRERQCVLYAYPDRFVAQKEES